MDTVTDYVSRKFKLKIGNFIVAGASKRGWTTWTTAAVDTRVIAAIPIVMGTLLLLLLLWMCYWYWYVILCYWYWGVILCYCVDR